MKGMKGVELPINILVIVAVAVVVLLGIDALYFVGWSPFPATVGVDNWYRNVVVEQIHGILK